MHGCYILTTIALVCFSQRDPTCVHCVSVALLCPVYAYVYCLLEIKSSSVCE